MKYISLLILSVMIPLLLGSCNGQNTKEEPKPDTFMVVDIPVVEKFVVVTVDGTTVYKEADANSPRRVMWMENIESDMADVQLQWSDKKVPSDYMSDPYPLFTGEVLAVLGEEGDFYLVNVDSPYADMTEGYILKKNTREVTPTPLTPKVAEQEEWASTHVVRDGRFKDLVFRAQVDELEGESLEIGMLKDGVIAYPSSYRRYIERSTRATGLEFLEADDPDNWGNLLFRYPESLVRTTTDGSEWAFETTKLTEAQMDSILQAIGRPASPIMRCQYYFPKLEGKYRSIYWSLPLQEK